MDVWTQAGGAWIFVVMSMDADVLREGDAGFVGFRSRPDALTLTEGVASYAQNMRFSRGRAEVRR